MSKPSALAPPHTAPSGQEYRAKSSAARLPSAPIDARSLLLRYGVAVAAAALAFLRREMPYTTAPRPDLILLDLNLPRKDGREVLAEVKADPALCHIPVILLTSTQTDADVRRAYAHGAAVYCVKPDDLDEHISFIQMIVELWGKRARLATG